MKNLIIVAASRSKKHRDLTLELGADYAVEMRDVEALINKLTHGLGASAAIDFVGTEETVYNLTKLLAQDTALVVVGMEGKKISVDTVDTIVWDKKY